jgi:hypothetical protein
MGVGGLLDLMRARLPTPEPFVVEARRLTASSLGAERWVQAFTRVVEATEGVVTQTLPEPGVWRLAIEGTIPPIFCASEQGVHLFRDPLGGLSALQVTVPGFGGDALQVVRRYVLPGIADRWGRAFDLRSGQDVPLGELRMRRWMLWAMPRGGPP